jgi:phage shock protein PspC (stress-responsive transcriptional regulator)
MSKFRRANEHASFMGVCAGLAYTMKMPVWVIRLLVVFSVLFLGFGVLAYILVGLFAPQWEHDPADFEQVCGD